MPALDLQDLHPEIAEAFLGKKPLISGRKHFASRADLLAAYAAFVTTTFGEFSTDRGAHCDLCGNANGNAAVLAVRWRARTRTYWVRVLVVVVFFPLILLYLLKHPTSLLKSLPENIIFAEHVRMTTAYPICAACAQRMSVRRFYYGASALLAVVLWIISGGLTALSGIGILVRLHVGANRDSFLTVVPLFVAAAAVFAGTILFWLMFSKRILLPTRAWELVKRPFTPESQELRQLLRPQRTTQNIAGG